MFLGSLSFANQPIMEAKVRFMTSLTSNYQINIRDRLNYERSWVAQNIKFRKTEKL